MQVYYTLVKQCKIQIVHHAAIVFYDCTDPLKLINLSIPYATSECYHVVGDNYYSFSINIVQTFHFKTYLYLLSYLNFCQLEKDDINI